PPLPSQSDVHLAEAELRKAERPVLLIGSQTLLDVPELSRIREAVEKLGVPVYLSGMARGLLGANHALQVRHKRTAALKEADLVVLLGVPMDFRLESGRHISRRAFLITVNRSARDGRKNRRPQLAAIGDAGRFLVRLAAEMPAPEGRWDSWIERLRK